MPNYGNASPGNPLPSFTLDMTDDALVSVDFAHITNGQTTFTDSGIMPVNPQTIAGLPLHLPGWADGLFIQYSSDGVQYFDQSEHLSTAVYSDLTYSLIAYKGAATFSHDPTTGAVTTTGIVKEAVVAQGSLINVAGGDRLSFNYSDPEHFITSGPVPVRASFEVSGKTVGTLNLNVTHATTDVGGGSLGMTLTGGSISALFTPTATHG